MPPERWDEVPMPEEEWWGPAESPEEDCSESGQAVDLAYVLGMELADPTEADGRPTLSELGNARRLVMLHGEDMRHCASLPGTGWLLWDGSRWAPDLTGQIMRWAKTLPDVLRAEAERRGWAQRCEAARTLSNSLTLLRTESTVPVTVQQLDADPWLLGTPGASVDLRTGVGREPARGDMMTRLTGVGYDRDAECPLWEAFLLDVMAGQPEMVAYLQRAVGYSLVGSTDEQVLLVLHGSGANGKSTFLETIRAVAGDYTRNVPADSLVGRREGTIPNDLAMLQGARFVTASETAENRPLDEALVKALTGGEPVTARYLNREFFEFQPQFTIWLATNHKPRVKGTDHGIWRRIHLVPFSVTIEQDKMDPSRTWWPSSSTSAAWRMQPPGPQRASCTRPTRRGQTRPASTSGRVGGSACSSLPAGWTAPNLAGSGRGSGSGCIGRSSRRDRVGSPAAWTAWRRR